MQPSSHASLTLRQFQSETDAIRETPIPRSPSIAIRLLGAMLVSLIAVTFLVRIDRVVTSTSGAIVPTQPVNVLQALDPSIIKSINVKEGQQVKKGQLLATLDPTFAAADVTQLKLQVAGLDAEIERAQAELAGRVPTFANPPDAAHANYASIQLALYQQRAAQYKAQVASYNEKILQTQATIEKFQNDEDRYKDREKISKIIEDMRSTLYQHQVGSRLNLLTATDQSVDLLRNLEFDHNSLIESRHQLAGLSADEKAFEDQWNATTSQELVTARNTRDTAIASLDKAVKRQDLVRLYASEDEVVLTVAKLSVGSVLKEGDSLMTLMPLRIPVEAEVQVLSRDIGFLRTGDPVTLKIDAFNSSEHGTADGRVKWISDDAFSNDDTGKPVEPYYKVRVKIGALHFIGVPANFRFIPGMTLAADIKVGKRSLGRYLLGGALNGLGEAMREP